MAGDETSTKSQRIDIQHHTQTRVGKIYLPQSKQIIDNQPFKKQSYQSSIIHQTEKDSI